MKTRSDYSDPLTSRWRRRPSLVQRSQSPAHAKSAGWIALLLLVPLTAVFLEGQGSQASSQQDPGTTEQTFPDATPKIFKNLPYDEPGGRPDLHKRVEALNAQRKKDLTKDSDKLLALATELKTEVDQTNKDTLSIDVIKKADEIEKLAKSVKQKMQSSI